MSARPLLVAVSAADLGGLAAAVSPHFGRCAAFTVVEVAEGRVLGHRVVPNPHAASHAPGDVPAFVAGLGARVVLSGGMGHRALAAFAAHGIEASVGHEGSVGDAVASYLAQGARAGEACGGRHGPDGGCHHHAPEEETR